MTDQGELFPMTYLTGIYSGKLVDPLNLSSSDIDIEDIAHSLALQCRYGGHLKFHYSVAQHSVILSYNVPKWLAFPALMHDACEGFITDLPYPIKVRLEGYYEMEEAVITSICHKFKIDRSAMDAVKGYDRRICIDEMNQLCNFQDPVLVKTTKALRIGKIREMDWRDARDEFLDRFYELYDGEDDSGGGPMDAGALLSVDSFMGRQGALV